MRLRRGVRDAACKGASIEESQEEEKKIKERNAKGKGLLVGESQFRRYICPTASSL